MKKIISILIMFFFISTSNCYALSELYYLKSIKTENLAPIVENVFNSQDFHLVKKNPYYGISQNNQQTAVVITQQSGENMFYYYQSDDNNRINKNILKNLKKLGITVEQSFNTSLIEIYENLAKEVASDSVALKTYTFEEPQSPAFEPPQQAKNINTQQNNLYRGYVAQLSSGTKIPVYLQNAIDTSTASQGDSVIAVLTNNLTYNGMEVAPQGSLVYGNLSKARPASYGSRNGRVVINFNKLVTPDNKVYNISTEEIDFTVSNEGKVGNSVKSAAGAAVVGALLGLLVGAISGGDHIGRNVAIGAGVGAGSSVIYSTAEKGVDAEIPSYTELELTLTQPLNISVGY